MPHPSFARRARSIVAALLACSLPTICAAQTTQPATQPADAAVAAPPTDGTEIGRNVNGQTWLDTSGHPINAHGAGMLLHEGIYYLYGETRAPRGANGAWTPQPGVHCYSSTDLTHWKDEGLALTVSDDRSSPFSVGCTIERPKVVRNAKTGKFVMWFHLELAGKSYSAAHAALAIADSPTGPFTFVKSLRPNPNTWPLDIPEDQRTPLTRDEANKLGGGPRAAINNVYARRDFASGQMSRDCTLFVDDDGKGYFVSSAEENYTLDIHELTDDYTGFTGKWTRILPGGHNEAPAIVKQDGKYYMLSSGCTGWAPNDARSWVADSIWGPWKSLGNPCTGTNPANDLGPDKTWGGQSTFILPLATKPGHYIAMFDLWRPRPDLIHSGYIWVPMTIENGKMHIAWQNEWKPE